ncbi:putative nascent polypeptide-associated complex alpha subunit [Cavenderia fasciculata]|uniref:Nascent polypeptide-associated complex alpha subunit n=1 Tax=Cavenderia fasciculata TaxID=261658 RepID=F4Q3C7_CACFS|nr:putative nascent polypeptide-associated complex alpha subunit [Cavenderia fasciculata]EGG17637.1 putative nascent polypeptide-associated complex alpha subunit [Cavenderia fasciculata]|eukprot:XP_004356121.1 putative nascent polypeptide-associated complex alpha subunit [Cavenderia fasciculata]
MATIEEIPEDIQVEDDEQTTTTGAGKKSSRTEKKNRAAIEKLGMKLVPDIVRATLKQSKGLLCVVAQPEVYKAIGSDTFVILGETTFEDPNASRARSAAKNIEEVAPKTTFPEPKTVASTSTTSTTTVADDEEVDLQGLDPKDVEVVMKESGGASKAKVVEALKKTGDIVAAVLELTQ